MTLATIERNDYAKGACFTNNQDKLSLAYEKQAKKRVYTLKFNDNLIVKDCIEAANKTAKRFINSYKLERN